jgi:hypothetical protein
MRSSFFPIAKGEKTQPTVKTFANIGLYQIVAVISAPERYASLPIHVATMRF